MNEINVTGRVLQILPLQQGTSKAAGLSTAYTQE